MDKEFYEKHGKDHDCAYCGWLQICLEKPEPVCVGGLLKYRKDKIDKLEKQLQLTEKALYKACEEAHSYIIESDYYWFGVYSADTFEWFDELSIEDKIKAHCDYFKAEANKDGVEV